MYAQWNNLTFIYVLIYRKHVPFDKAFGLFSAIKRTHVWKNSYHLNRKLFHINSKHFLWSVLHKIRIFLSISLTPKAGWIGEKNAYKSIYLPTYLPMWSLTHMYISIKFWLNIGEIQRLKNLGDMGVMMYDVDSRKMSAFACSCWWLVVALAWGSSLVSFSFFRNYRTIYTGPIEPVLGLPLDICKVCIPWFILSTIDHKERKG